MVRGTVKLKLTNQSDHVLRQHRVLKRTPRQAEIEALVDTGATRLYLKPSVIKALGLRKTGEVNSRTTKATACVASMRPCGST